MKKLFSLYIIILFILTSCTQKHSEAFERYLINDLDFEAESPLFPEFTFSEVTGLGYFGNPETDPLIQEKLEKYQSSQGPFYYKLNKKEP